ncbi:MAG: hypothetical protein IPP31_03925 [Chitinophagaceae bacterium]|nr:hypothetical protein [Chitinophagaceae bacterium]
MIRSIYTACLFGGMLFALSCNSGEQKTNQDAVLKSDSDTAKKDVAPVKPADLMIIKHKVADFDKWLSAYEADDSVRQLYGLHNYGISRGVDDPNQLMVTLKIDDINRAKEFASLPALKAKMKAGGVTGEPDIFYFDRQELDLSTNNIPIRVMIRHKVKDWATWKKEFDSHKQTRLDAGIVDRAVGFEVGNNKLVNIVAVVNDLKKAKAFFASKDLKDKMQAAGVESEPTIDYYNLFRKF